MAFTAMVALTRYVSKFNIIIILGTSYTILHYQVQCAKSLDPFYEIVETRISSKRKHDDDDDIF